MAQVRTPDWYFISKKELLRLAASTPEFTDTSYISAFVSGGETRHERGPWDFEESCSAAIEISSASVEDERFADGKEFRFFVGKVACKSVPTYQKLVNTASMCTNFKAALMGDPAINGAAPWMTVVTSARLRGDGILKGPSAPIIAASRDPAFSAAADCAVLIFTRLSASETREARLEALKEVIALGRAAGNRCPIDLSKVQASLSSHIVEDAFEDARSLGAATDNVTELLSALSTAVAWLPGVVLEWDPHLSLETATDIAAMLDAVKTHYTADFAAAKKIAEKSRTALLKSV